MVLGDVDHVDASTDAVGERPSPIKAVLVLLLTVFSGVIAAVAVGMIIAAFIFMKKVADISEQQTTISPLAAEPWVDERDLAAVDRDGFPVDHVEGPLFFGFARGFTEIAPGARAGKLLVLRTDLVSFMEAYALQGDLADLKAAGIRIPIVGLNVAQLDTLGALHLIPEAVPENADSGDAGRAFRLMSATCSDRSRPAVPIEVGRGGGSPAGLM